MTCKRTIALSFLACFFLAAFAAAAPPSSALIERRASELGTDGPSSQQAHQLLSGEHRCAFPYPTFVVGIEKAPRDRIRSEPPGSYRSSREQSILRNIGQACGCLDLAP